MLLRYLRLNKINIMMKNVLSLIAVFALTMGVTAQSAYFERYILGTGGTINDTLGNGTVVTLDLSTDDVEQENSEVDSYYDDDLDAGWEGDPADQNLLTLGLRFQDIQIAQGTTIDSAFVVFHAHEGKSAADVAMLTIVGEAADNAVTFDQNNFNDTYLLTDRPQTSAQVDWTVAEDWVIWQPYKTNDIASVVQEIVNRPGWMAGNALALIFLPENQGPSTVENAREFTSFENIADPDDVDPQGNAGDGTNHPERRPYLQVYYQGSVSVSELALDFCAVYPNPVMGDVLNINLRNGETATAVITNVSGQVVREVSLNGYTTAIDVANLNAGMYFVQVTQGEATSIQKVLVK